MTGLFLYACETFYVRQQNPTQAILKTKRAI